jgi:hypothetical protein
MSGAEPADATRFEPGFGRGGVPWYLLLYYLAFLAFFTWYVLEYQLEDYVEKQAAEAPAGPGR